MLKVAQVVRKHNKGRHPSGACKQRRICTHKIKVKSGDCLEHTNHKIVRFDSRKSKVHGSRTATLDFQRADFGLFRMLVDRMKESRKSECSSRRKS